MRTTTGLTLVEMVIAIALMVIIFAAVVPSFRAILNSWDSKAGTAETLQNGRILIDHLNRNLSKAVKTTSVSSPSQTSGFIVFKDNDGNSWRYDVNSTTSYVEFGRVGSLSDLAGPVSLLTFTCYDACGLDTNTPTMDVNTIRVVKVRATLTNSATLGQDKTFTASAYLRANANNGGLVGCWKLDEASGATAADSSGNGRNGTLYNMSSPTCWGPGKIGSGALNFDGVNDYVSLPIGSAIGSLTNCSVTSWIFWGGGSYSQRIWDFGTGTTRYMCLTTRNSSTGTPRFAITNSGSAGENQTTAPSALSAGVWHHIAVTIDADNHTHSLYLDGTRIAQNTSAVCKPSDLGNTTNNWLARSQYSADPCLYAALDDVRIYDRALSATEIAQLVNILTYRDLAETKAGSDVASLAISTPGTTAVGDLLIAAIATDGNTYASIAAPVGGGWTLIDRGTCNGEVTLGAWWKKADTAGTTSHTFTWTGSQQAYGWMMRFTGQHATNPINGTPVATNSISATPTSPAVSTTVNNCLILRLGAFDNDEITVDSPGLAGHTAITMDKSSADPTGLVGWWKLNETSGTTAADSSGSGNNGTLVNMTPATDWVTGMIGGGLDMDGVDDYVNCGNGASLNITAKITLAAWVKTRDTGDGQFNPYIAKGDYGYELRNNTNTEMAFSIRGSDGAWHLTYSATSGFNNVWHHVAGTYDGSNLRLYIDGVLKFTLAYVGSIATNTYPVNIGRNSEQTTRLYNGVIDDARIYNRALSTAEIAQLATGPVSGGAGYTNQSAIGSSGTSTFTLGSSNEARALTIAIAPADNSTYDCCGDYIKP
ncbi:MAG: LamG-like jellyroll fold domain-containing protein [Sedimentisphaerales bacterium]